MSITNRGKRGNYWNKTLARSHQYVEMLEARAKIEAFQGTNAVRQAFKEAERVKSAPSHTRSTSQPLHLGLEGGEVMVYSASVDMSYGDRPQTSPSASPTRYLGAEERPSTSPNNKNHLGLDRDGDGSASALMSMSTSASTKAPAKMERVSSRPSTSPTNLFTSHGMHMPYENVDETNLLATRSIVSSARANAPLPLSETLHDAGASRAIADGSESVHDHHHHHKYFPHLKFKASRRKMNDLVRPSTTSAVHERSDSLLLVEDHTSVSSAITKQTTLASSSVFSLNSIQRQRKRALFKHLKGTNTDMALTPLQKREMRDRILLEKKRSIIEKRGARGAEKRAMLLEAERVRKWLQFNAALNTTKRLKEIFDAEMVKKATRVKRNKAAASIQKAWETYYAPIRHRKKQSVQMALVKFSFRLLGRLARIRQRLARKKVLRFYADFSRQRFAFVMVKFRFNCVKLQRRIRSYAECSKSRLLVLSMFWNSIEGDIKKAVERNIQAEGEANALGGKWEVKLVGRRFPELAMKINVATEETVNLKKTIQKGINTVSATLPKLLEKAHSSKLKERIKGRRRTSAIIKDINSQSCVPESEKLAAIKSYLTTRRAEHGEMAWNVTRGGDVAAKQLDIEAAGQILRGELDIRKHVDYQVNKIAWPTFMMLTDKRGKEQFRKMVEHHVQRSLERKNKEIQRLVRERLQRELNEQSSLKDLPGGYRWIKEGSKPPSRRKKDGQRISAGAVTEFKLQVPEI